jgi:hypothetical protein
MLNCPTLFVRKSVAVTILGSKPMKSRSQSYDRELQRQRCKFYNATRSLENFGNKKYFCTVYKNALAYYNSGIVVINSKVVGMAPGQKSLENAVVVYFMKKVFRTHFRAPNHVLLVSCFPFEHQNMFSWLFLLRLHNTLITLRN